MPKILKLPYWRLSAYYFFYFAALGCYVPYWALYLQSLGFNHAEIGQLMAILPAAKIISPNLWAWLSDHTDRSVLLIRLTSFLTTASFAMVFWGNDYLWMAWATVLMGLFSSAPMPIFEAVTLSYLQQDTHRYSRIRIWGSIGFVAAVFATGWAINAGLLLLECVPTVVFLAFSSMVLVALCLPSRSVRRADLDQGSLKTIIKRPGVVAFFLAFFLIQMAHGPYYTFFSVFLKERGYDASQTGWLWSLGILAEIFLFWHFHKLFPRFSVRAMLLAAIALSVLRWLLIGWWVENLIALSIAQILHAASFGATHVSAMQFIHRHFGAGHQGKGQALYSSLSFGLGGMVGSYLSGEVWASFGPEFVFSAAAGVTLLAWIIAWGWVDRPVRAENGRVST